MMLTDDLRVDELLRNILLTVHGVLSIRYEPNMSLSFGGIIEQTVHEDKNDPHIWDVTNSRLLNIQTVNSVVFEIITGFLAPPKPISLSMYVSYGLPFYSTNDEKSSKVSSNFENVKSVQVLSHTSSA